MSKGYPKTRFEIVDQTNVNEIPTNTIVSSNGSVPLALSLYTSDKGPEEWRVISDFATFSDQIGAISFNRHGQAQLTIAEELRNGAAVFCKRLVSKNATLANTTVHAKIVKSGDVCYVYYYTKSDENVKTFEEACQKGYGDFDSSKIISDEETPVDIPLFTVTPMGRGASNITFRIVPESLNRNSGYILFSFEVYDNNELLEQISFTFNANIKINGVSYAMNPKVKVESKQVKVHLYEDALVALLNNLAVTAKIEENSITAAQLSEMDFINGINKYGQGSTNIGGVVTSTNKTTSGEDNWTTNKPEDITDDNICDLSSDIGISLPNGSYGTLTNNPMSQPEEYKELLLGALGAKNSIISEEEATFDELFDSVIYDLDKCKLDFICDCNYPLDVKKAIINLVDFRGDLVYFADLGLKVNSIKTIKEEAAKLPESKFTAIYHNYCKVYDPYTSKQIDVTIPYLLIPKIINHINDGVGRPFAGILHNITFNNIIENTINFLPVEIPGLDQKQALIESNVNYISYYNNTPVMETMYVNTSEYSQLSYLHNIMAIQQVIKAIRDRCPRTRYTFMDSSNLQRYIDDATTVINQYSNNFKSISIQYMADKAYESNNIFYAVIRVTFNNFINEEYFKVIAIDG